MALKTYEKSYLTFSFFFFYSENYRWHLISGICETILSDKLEVQLMIGIMHVLENLYLENKLH